jgi:hypothetical protein
MVNATFDPSMGDTDEKTLYLRLKPDGGAEEVLFRLINQGLTCKIQSSTYHNGMLPKSIVIKFYKEDENE